MISEKDSAELYAYWKSLADVDFKPSTVQIKLDGLVYTSTKLAAATGVNLWPRVVSLLGAGTTRLVAGAGNDTPTVDWWAAITIIADRATRIDFVGLIKELLDRMQCNALRGGGEGKVVPAFDTHFSGEYVHLLKVCALALAHNFRGPTLGGH